MGGLACIDSKIFSITATIGLATLCVVAAGGMLRQVTGLRRNSGLLILSGMISMRLLSRGAGGSLNVKGAYLEVWSSIGVIVGAIMIRVTGWVWLDSASQS